MANFFPRWTNTVPLKIVVALAFVGAGVSMGVAYYFTPKYTRVGYQPAQPVNFNHKLHVGQVGLDCRYCHSYVETTAHSNVPTNQTCYNCHGPGKGQIKLDSPELELVRTAPTTDMSIPWIQIHKTPDYVYFNHSAHVNRGVSCQNCHGQVNEMPVVYHDQPQSMGWCLECHRNTEDKLRPLDQITNLNYKPSDLDRKEFYAKLLAGGAKGPEILELIEGNGAKNMRNERPGNGTPAVSTDNRVDRIAGREPQADGADAGNLTADALAEYAQKKFGNQVTQSEVGRQLKAHWQIHAPETCGACHR